MKKGIDELIGNDFDWRIDVKECNITVIPPTISPKDIIEF